MADAATYSAIEVLRNGRRVEIRALRPDDRSGFAEAAGRSSAESLRRRFFTAKRTFTEQEVSFFVDVDFVNHVALVAVAEEGGRPTIIGGARYFVVRPGQAEVAFTVPDHCQGQGVGAALMRHVTEIAREAGIKELIADVLRENTPMLRVFEKSGLSMSTKPEGGVAHVVLRLF